ncbi:hypothetical protein KIW84_057310 [Lathyrus oleraceus]|uniref:Uncharacterized protein n=1 Tax=Pisum sativum TaxID=3888 RepID=A0A9D5ANN6_PEA|nr:hypothetical protein KIW84_057310 [Pisum sativum]
MVSTYYVYLWPIYQGISKTVETSSRERFITNAKKKEETQLNKVVQDNCVATEGLESGKPEPGDTRDIHLSPSVDIPNIKIGINDQLRKRSALLEALEASDDNTFVPFKAEVKGKEAIESAFNPESSEFILYKLLGNANQWHIY